MKSFSLIILLFIATTSFGQNCQIEGKDDWEKVEIRTLTQMQAPEGSQYLGEDIMRKVSANSITDLTQKQIKEIKQKTAEFGGCIVYVDFNNLYQVPYGLYYVWTNEGSSTQE